MAQCPAWLCAVQIASEAKRLDRLGLQVPQVALNAALQQPRHRQAVEGLATMLDDYRRASTSASVLSGSLTHERNTVLQRGDRNSTVMQAKVQVYARMACSTCLHRNMQGQKVCWWQWRDRISRHAGIGSSRCRRIKPHAVCRWDKCGSFANAEWVCWQVTAGLTPIEAELLAARTGCLDSALAAGFTTVNWLSLTVHQFVKACNQARLQPALRADIASGIGAQPEFSCHCTAT